MTHLVDAFFGLIAINTILTTHIIERHDSILSMKKDTPQADTTAEKREIDRLVYALYPSTKLRTGS